MKTLFLDCNMGVAGDMFSAALYELLDEPGQNEFLAQMNDLGLPGVVVIAEKKTTCGIVGTHLRVQVHGEEEVSQDVPAHEHAHDHTPSHSDAHSHSDTHSHNDAHSHSNMHGHNGACGHAHDHVHRTPAEIRALITALPVSERVRADVAAVYDRIAEAEARVHGVPVSDIHFHEVGTLDALADITAASLLIETLAPGQILASPIRTGYGTVQCAHGVLPVPAPATAELLKGIPVFSGEVSGELCTPTGAALVRHFATRFGEMPVMRVEKIGYGIGTKDLPIAGCVRAHLGETEPIAQR